MQFISAYHTAEMPIGPFSPLVCGRRGCSLVCVKSSLEVQLKLILVLRGHSELGMSPVGRKKKGMIEYEIPGWHLRLNGHEFEQTLGDSEGW